MKVDCIFGSRDGHTAGILLSFSPSFSLSFSLFSLCSFLFSSYFVLKPYKKYDYLLIYCN